jgi:alanine racemase
MATGTLRIDLAAIAANWRSLNACSEGETAAVVKADGYGLGADAVAHALMSAGVRQFFVATAEEGASLRRGLGPDAVINVLSGHMAGDTDLIRRGGLVPMLNSMDQIRRHFEALPEHGFGVQLDTGMNRLGLEPAEWQAVREIALGQGPALIMSHLACADEPDHPMNRAQLDVFTQMTDGVSVPRSLAATGGILLGPEYHFDLTRPGIGLYGGLPYTGAAPVVRLDIPVIQIRELEPGETVGYGAAWTARRPTRLATIAAGYADGLIRAMGPKAQLWHQGQPLPAVGRVSMDMIAVDVTDAPGTPHVLQMIGPDQSIDRLAEYAGTIGYEILTSLSDRYGREYLQ